MSRASKDKGGAKLDSVQLLRALAASMVVLGHTVGAVRMAPTTFGLLPRLGFAGGAGVDVFFLISGFIMVLASGRMYGSIRGAYDFLLRRLVRIAPLYWCVTLLSLALFAARGHGWPRPAAIAASLAFFPYDTDGRGDGFAFPIIDLGWTLNYEMLFYFAFAFCLPFGRRACVIGVAAIMAMLVTLGHVMQPTTLALHFWTQPIVLEFVAGMIVALAWVEGRLRLGLVARLALVALAIGYYLFDPVGVRGQGVTANDFVRVAGWGVPSALMLVAAVAGPVPLQTSLGHQAVRLGDSSYALYLIHPFVIPMMMKVAPPVMALLPAPVFLFVTVTVVAALLAAVLVHILIERPVTVWLTRAIRHGGAPIGAVPLPSEERGRG